MSEALVVTLLDLPTDVWTHILEDIIVYDLAMLHTTNKRIHKISNSKLKTSKRSEEELVLEYFAGLGTISCLEYCRALGMEWDAGTMAEAARKGQLEVIKFLNDNKCDHDLRACKEAASNGHFECLKYMHENGFPWDQTTAESAARSNNLEMLKYMHQNGCVCNAGVLIESAQHSLDCLKYMLDNGDKAHLEYVDDLCTFAASAGKLETMKFLVERNYSLTGCCQSAAGNGHLDCLKYAQENGGEWGYTIDYAAYGGHIECIKYALQNGDSPLKNEFMFGWPVNASVESGSVECVKFVLEQGGQWTGREYNTAASRNDLRMIKYLLEEAHCPKPYTNEACIYAAGNLEMLKYLHENGFQWDGVYIDYENDEPRTVVYQAVQKKSLPCLKYILESGHVLDTSDVSLCEVAASKNDVEMLKLLIGLGYQRPPSIMHVAVEHGAFDVVKYLHENGTELDESVCMLAADFGHPAILEYALKNGCGFSSIVTSVAALNGHISCLKVARKFGVPWTARACLSATKNSVSFNRLKCVKYLHENGCRWTHEECTVAAGNHDLKVLKYAHENGCEWSEKTWYAAYENDAIECLEYLFANGCPQDRQTYWMMRNSRCKEFVEKNILKKSTT